MKSPISVIIISSLLFNYSCKKAEVIPPPTPDGNALHNFFSVNTNAMKQTFTVDPASGASVTGNQGTAVHILPNSLYDVNNNLVTGNVTVELIEIFDRSAMLLANKPTVGIMPNGDHALMVSGGEYYLNIHQNGLELHADPAVNVIIPTSITGGADNAMASFTGVFDGPNDGLIWQANGDSLEINADSISYSNYFILENTWGWTNVDRFYDDPSPKTTLLVELPEGFNLSNSEVFLAYEGEPNALARLDTFTDDGYFSEHYGQIPIGLNVHVIAVAFIDDQLHYEIKSTSISAGGILTITELAPTTQAQLAVLIDALP